MLPSVIRPPTVSWLYQTMFPNRFFTWNVPHIWECVATRVRYCDILNPSLSSVCSSGDLGGPSSIFPVVAGGHGHGDPDWQSSPNPPGGRTRLIGSEQIWRRSETKDKEVRARALTSLMSRGGALATCQSDVQEGATRTHVPPNTPTETRF